MSDQFEPCGYVTSGWGVHDERWVSALENQGFHPHVFRLGIDGQTVDDIRGLILSQLEPQAPVFAGPLDSITQKLIGLPNPLIGLSWGFDLHSMSDLSWLADLHGLIVDSSATYEIARDVGVNESSITILPWGVDLETFTPNGVKVDWTRWGIPMNASIALSLRAHEPKYRVQDIIEAFAHVAAAHASAHLVVGHAGSLTKQLKEFTSASVLEDRVTFIGTTGENELPALLRGADVYVTASEVDGSSVTLLQAMACGALVVASDTPGNRGWVSEGETGLLFATGDTDELNRQLLAALSMDHSVRGAITARALEEVRTRANWAQNQGLLGRALRLG